MSPQLGVTPNNLPVQLTSFVGRDCEIETLSKIALETRLLTLTGAGGVGKTRLGLQVASQLLVEFENGIWWVDLGSIYEPAMVVHKVSSILDCRAEGAQSRTEALKDILQGKDLLLTLDNCEHLVQTCAELVDDLLRSCPNLQVITTSREPLGVPGETVYQVNPLSLPDEDKLSDHDSLFHSEAVQLFNERARNFQPSFQIDQTNSSAIAQICLLLDGLPLAIELAAARVRALSPQQIAEHLKDSLEVLASGGRTVASRQQTLQASIEWSHALLSKAEQTLFRRLAVFAGGFILEDVEAVCSGEFNPYAEATSNIAEGDRITPSNVLQSSDILDLLFNLVDKSLLRVLPDWENSYRMLNPIQRFAWKKMTQSGERDLLRNQHLGYFLDLAARAQPMLMSAEQSNWWERMELEIDNFHAALDWSLQSKAIESGMRLACELGEFWWRHGYISEALEWLKRLLASDYPEDTIRARALIQAGRMSREIGDHQRATLLCTRGLELCQEFNYQEGIAEALCLLGVIAHYDSGDLNTANELLSEGLAIYQQLGDEWKVSINRLFFGDVQQRSGDYPAASKSFNECLDFFQKYGDKWGIGFSLGGLADLARFQGDYEGAMTLFRQSLELHDKINTAFLIEAVAAIFSDLGQYIQAANLWGFAEAWRETTHSLIPPSYHGYYAPHRDTARSSLGEVDFKHAWQEGRSLTLEEAFALTNQPLPEVFETPAPSVTEKTPSPTTPDPAEQYGLTIREAEVLRLVASGLSDTQVAEELFISPRTVSKHLQSIYRKLQVNSRSAATRFALEHNMA